jgi:DNA-binding LacI/PurR family transcriptional regulator
MYIYEKIRQDLLVKITGLEPHVRIPTRNAMCKEYMVTRTTIDRAVEELMAKGYLYAVAGSGTFVSDMAANVIISGSSSMSIGALLPDITADTYPAILRGIQDIAEKKGVSIIACNTDNQSEIQSSLVHRLVNSKVNALIIIPVINSNADYALFQFLENAKLPYVFCNRNIGGINKPCICSNDFYGSFLATTHLIDKGYKRIVYLSSMFYKTSMDRYQGYLAALSARGRQINTNLILIGEATYSSQLDEAKRLLKDLLEKDAGVDAVVCFNDRVACVAIEVIQAMGLRVSDDVGLIGYDNTKTCTLLPVKLSSVDYRNYEIGQCAAEMLIQMVEHPDYVPRRITTFEPQIVVRDSCKGPSKRS